MHLEEFQDAQKNFNKALDRSKDPIEKAKVLNNKGLAFLCSKQYQKAIECFDEGIALDSEGKISVLCENKQVR